MLADSCATIASDAMNTDQHIRDGEKNLLWDRRVKQIEVAVKAGQRADVVNSAVTV
jgi:hypothetical protein